MTDSPLAALLRESFPAYTELDSGCWVRLSISEAPDDFGDVISLVDAAGERPSLMRRLTAEHPTGRTHHAEHDARLLDVFIEATALAWAARTDPHAAPAFIFEEGAPDLRMGADWVEAKAINRSDFERGELDALQPVLNSVGWAMREVRILQPVPEPVYRKLDEKLEDAQKKLARQSKGRMVVFFDVSLDFGVLFREARAELIAWAREKAGRTGCRIVICYRRHDWRSPLVDTGWETVNPK